MSVTDIVFRRQTVQVFVTGASGLIGSAFVPELLAAGHQVLALARSDASAAVLAERGVEVLRGDLGDLDVLRAGARAADAVVHLAFQHDFTDFAGAVAVDRAAIDTLGAALAGTGRPFTIASGTPAVPGRAATEEDFPQVPPPLGGRMDNALATLALADRGVRSSIVRLPRTVHADGGRGGFAGLLVRTARRTGVSGYVADGSARWPAAHVGDVARLFLLALDVPAGTTLHAVGDEGVSVLDTATAIGRGLDVPVQPVEAEALGFLGQLATLDQPASSALTRERFGWEPEGPSLLENLGAGNYVLD
nr:SDR family oxidoreductase [Kineococcus rhizosphaerae]